MRIAYFDCFAGISGGMLLGALLGAGLSLDALQRVLSGLAFDGYELAERKVVRKELSGTFLSVMRRDAPGNDPAPHGLERLAEVTGWAGHATYSPARTLGKACLPDIVKQTSLAIFRRLDQAEGAISPRNGKTPAHENGNVVASAQPVEEIISVVGVVAGLSLLGINRVECSPVHVGSGVLCDPDGIRPALSPVVAEIFRAASVPIYGSHVAGELVSPVGAAIIATLASAFGAIPAMKICAVGYGAGKYDLTETPSLVRLFIGEPENATGRLRTTEHLSQVEQSASPTGSAPTTAHLNGETDPAAPPPSDANRFIANREGWTALASKGHQQSGRQRIAS